MIISFRQINRVNKRQMELHDDEKLVWRSFIFDTMYDDDTRWNSVLALHDESIQIHTR